MGQHTVAYKIATDGGAAVEFAYIADDGITSRPCRQRIALSPSWQHFEALGFWFLCPNCGRRVERLYLPSTRAKFMCRRCSGLTYASSQIHDHRVDQLRRDGDRVLSILSGEENVSETMCVLALKAAALGAPRRHERRKCG